MSLAILFHFLCAQHVSDINISIIRSLRLCCWITTSVVLFSVRCVLELWCGWFWVVSVLQAEVVLQPATRTLFKLNRTKSSNTQRTENKTTDAVIQQHRRKLLMMDILMSETCWAHKKWNKIASDIKLVFHSSNALFIKLDKVLKCTLKITLACSYMFRSTTVIMEPSLEPSYSYTVCPTRYRTRHFFNNFTTTEDIATKFEADLPHCVRNLTS